MATEICDHCGNHCEWLGIAWDPGNDCTWLATKEHRNGEKSTTVTVLGSITKNVAPSSTGKGKVGKVIPIKAVTAPAIKATHKESSPGDVTESKKVIVDPLTQKIWGLAAKKLPTRQIAEQLKAEGIVISHMTVARRLQGKMEL